MDPTQHTLLTASKISKRFGATCALHSADLIVKAGQVHALMGENGAGKSTLVKILVGALRYDTGSVAIRGVPTSFHSVRDAITAGIIPVYQHSTLFPELSVTENLQAFDLAKESPVRISRRASRVQEFIETAARIGLKVDAQQPVSELSMAERQLLEIARGVARKCDVLILDEPTAALNAHEAERLFVAIAKLKMEGKGIVFISHKLGEIARICDVITVLRDGRTVIEATPAKSLNSRQIIEAMVGPVADRPERRLPKVGSTQLTVSDLGCGRAFEGLSLSVGRGEIVGIAGLIGSGALEVGEVLGGGRRPTTGRIQVDGLDIANTSRKCFKTSGVGLIPADRTVDGIFPGLNCAINAVASTYASISAKSFVSNKIEVRASEKLFRDLRVRPGDPSTMVSALSGGNQQKLLIIRNLLVPGMTVLVAIEPTRGVDVHARDAIHDAIVNAAHRGISVILASSDIDEVHALSHRVYVMRSGRLANVFDHMAKLSHVLACITGATHELEEIENAHA
jgi:ABC-type sugar transport system ATPase subunit